MNRLANETSARRRIDRRRTRDLDGDVSAQATVDAVEDGGATAATDLTVDQVPAGDDLGRLGGRRNGFDSYRAHGR